MPFALAVYLPLAAGSDRTEFPPAIVSVATPAARKAPATRHALIQRGSVCRFPGSSELGTKPAFRMTSLHGARATGGNVKPRLEVRCERLHSRRNYPGWSEALAR